MPEIGPNHPLTYRREILAPLFGLMRSAESCAVIGPASMGKSRLLQFLLRSDVRQHYLGEAAASTWLVLADCNRLAEVSEWGLYELLLTALTETPDTQHSSELRDWLNKLRRDTIAARDALLARRYLELATRVLCREHGFRLCFILDEFDAAYRGVPSASLANLRALRDADRYSLFYVLMLRDSPERLRPVDDVEGFYELVSRSILGLGPYSATDAARVIEQLSVRRAFLPTSEQTAAMLILSGGHPGLIVALFDVAARHGFPQADGGAVLALLEQAAVLEECRKLWDGLVEDEQLGLSHLAQGIGAGYTVRRLLALKGLITSGDEAAAEIFSPLFKSYILTKGTLAAKGLWLDEAAAVAWVEGCRIASLTRLEFDLLRMLYSHLNQVCSRDEIVAGLYPDETTNAQGSGMDNRVDSLVRHLRRAIEPDPARPRYLLTVRGRGYRLCDTPAPRSSGTP